MSEIDADAETLDDWVIVAVGEFLEREAELEKDGVSVRDGNADGEKLMEPVVK